jgi:hypothetical protein
MNELDRQILTFEDSQWWKYEGAKGEAIIIRFDLSLTQYYQTLNRLLSDPQAEREFPVTVKRLRSLQQQRKVERYGRLGA